MEYGLRYPMKPKPKPTKAEKPKARKKKTNRQKLIIELSNLMRELTTWRDGCICVLSEVDGGRCSEVSQWGHVIPQGGSGYLKHSLSNSFRQCSSHNKIHDKINPLLYINWYRHKFGSLATDMLDEASKKTYHIFSIQDLIDMRDNLKQLIENRYSMNGASLAELVDAGYYGEIIREAWIKEAKI